VSRLFVRIALRIAAYRSYRDAESKEAVRAFVDVTGDPVYPDLAFSYPYAIGGTSNRSGSRDPRLLVGVSPIAYCDPRVWPQRDNKRYTAYLSQLTGFVKWLIKEQYRVLLFTTDSPDMATVSDLQAAISEMAGGADAIETLPGSLDQSPDSLLKAISRADLTIASRLHGVILSHLNATPVLALSFDQKVDAHMQAIGQKDYCLNIDRLQLETLIDRFGNLKAARHREAENLHAAALRFRHLLDEQYERITGASRTGVGSGPVEAEINVAVLSKTGGLKVE
jgi:polysaccharide pyruvyl transferase WcaK-like protein